MSQDPGLKCLRQAVAAPVYDVAKRTPLDPAPNLSHKLGARVWLKREDLQPSFSFKVRGAYTSLYHRVKHENLSGGVVAASAGNHAQGVARAAARLALKADIVMPQTTPSIKIDAVRQLGAKVHVQGDNYDQACDWARQMASEQNLTFIHPFDDPLVIAGQATIGLELLNQATEPPAWVFVPVGGGGLLAGVAAVIKTLNPETKIVAVEPEDAACLAAAMAAGKPVTLDRVGIFADGAAVRRVGDHPFALAQSRVDHLITVSADEICAAMRDIFEDTRALVEPAGAMAVAGMKKLAAATPGMLRGAPLVAINSGANINFSRMSHVVERAAVGLGEEALLSVTIPETPGSYLKFLKTLRNPSVTEFNYRYRNRDEAHIFIGLAVEGRPDEPAASIRRLNKAGYPVMDLSHDELARQHLRHMVGGRGPEHLTERVMRFEFPERPGALLEFLTRLAGRWTISLFHYRNHGAAYGRVLVGFLVGSDEDADFGRFLNATGYVFSEETSNPAYQQFLAPRELEQATTRQRQ